MAQIATKFVKWDVPELMTLQDSRVYKLRERLNNGGKLNREEKNWITRNVRESVYFKRGIALSGYHLTSRIFSNGTLSSSTDTLVSITPLTKRHYTLCCTEELRSLSK